MPEIEIDVSLGGIDVLTVSNVSGTEKVLSSPARLYGWSLYNTSSTDAVEGFVTSGGNYIGAIAIPIGGVVSPWFGPNGLKVLQDISLVISAGSVSGAVYAIPYH